MAPLSAELIKLKHLSKQIRNLEETGLIAPASDEKPHLKSLTFEGTLILPKGLRHSRDKSRLFSLKRARLISRHSCGGNKNLAGDSPAMDSSSSLQGRRPKREAVDSSALPLWPSTFRQLDISAGSFRPPREYLPLYSFSSFETLHRASHSEARHERDIRLRDIALAIGISPRLITSIISRKSKHYRSFLIGKKGGGTRTIDAPRTFLKTIQAWIADYILQSLPISEHCHSYIRHRSILTNAKEHARKEYVANIDIKNFFNSITEHRIRTALSEVYETKLSSLISKICTYNNSIPQGSPASPVLSNFFLTKFDHTIGNNSDKLNATYTRYADDITISADSKDSIQKIINQCTSELNNIGLFINDRKTRITSSSGQQVVTGLTVNTTPAPPRKYRRTVRALIHNAALQPKQYIERASEIAGHIAYLESFPHLKNREDIKTYKGVLRSILAAKK